MRIGIAIVIAGGCSGGERGEPVESPPEPAVQPQLPSERVLASAVSDDGLRIRLEELFRKLPEWSSTTVCIHIDASGRIAGKLLEDEDGVPVKDPEIERAMAEIERDLAVPWQRSLEEATRASKLWFCNHVGPRPPQNIPPTLLEGSRISGEPQILPSDETKAEIRKSGRNKIISSWKLCIDVSGTVASVKSLKASGFPAYDQKIETEMARWKYRPFEVSGKPVPVCTAITFIYSPT